MSENEMRVKLSGYNVDVDTIGTETRGTPETLVAAYARISRSSDPLAKIRRDAYIDDEALKKSRETAQRVAYEYGHLSVSEHAVFNFDIENVSRLLVEMIERTRLGSYTEKSQRYVTMTRDYHIPEELKDSDRIAFTIVMDNLFELYKKISSKLIDYHSTSKNDSNSVENKAKEDARYVLPLSTNAQLGMTLNARSLDNLLMRLRASRLSEAHLLADKLAEEVQRVAPSLLRSNISSIQLGKYRKSWQNLINSSGKAAWSNLFVKKGNYSDIRVDAAIPPNYFDPSLPLEATDLTMAAVCLFSISDSSFLDCVAAVSQMNSSAIIDLINIGFENLLPDSAVAREFEIINFFIHTHVSASCFAQLKRHRIATIIPQSYNVDLQREYPESFRYFIVYQNNEELKELSKSLNDSMEQVFRLYTLLSQNYSPEVANYALTNSHQRNVLVVMNMRELYHFSRMRCDYHAQEEIRNLAHKVVEKVKIIAPVTGEYLGGKDKWKKLKN